MLTKIKYILQNAHKGNKTLPEQIIKAQEELGELAAAYLMSKGKKSTTKTKQEVEDNFIEETIDCLIILFAIAGTKKYTLEQIEKVFELKLNKWKSKLKDK